MSLASDRHLVLEEFSTELLAAPKWREMGNVNARAWRACGARSACNDRLRGAHSACRNVKRETRCTFRDVTASGARVVRASAVHAVHAGNCVNARGDKIIMRSQARSTGLDMLAVRTTKAVERRVSMTKVVMPARWHESRGPL